MIAKFGTNHLKTLHSPRNDRSSDKVMRALSFRVAFIE